eukprot:CAMPEP_0182548804 /NCGR_PEP_ID=MMETSP1323-20130603/39314_1 /TAXON_ID=236787 /ORGANISM="Florenciella parvula, Strain RCC1693" /LENGTH=55 /DNA_ID=CAMNT_0024760219 /DNA_START=28 /DNA_END=195 /DNA_ORIENTATION=+
MATTSSSVYFGSAPSSLGSVNAFKNAAFVSEKRDGSNERMPTFAATMASTFSSPP